MNPDALFLASFFAPFLRAPLALASTILWVVIVAPVAAQTRDRVQEAMRALRFQPDAVARSLRAGTDVSVGFVVESIADPFFAEVIDSVETALGGHGRPVLVASTRRESDR